MGIGSVERPLRVAVVGSGPSGFYAAEALLKQKDVAVTVDMYDRLPTPYGLVRGGVAPDHQSIKNVIKVYDKTASLPGFRFFGNVKVGDAVEADHLRSDYDAIIWAVGAESDRHLGIPGEELDGSHSATAFVGWYNAHPDHCDNRFDLDCERVAVVGVGNVAMDVTRVLVAPVAELEKTDIADYAMEALRHSKVREVIVLGRRGVAQAAFSPPEIKEIGDLAGVDLVVRPDEVTVDALSAPDLEDANVRKNVEYCTERSLAGEGTNARKVRLRFLVSPVEILGEHGRVTAIRVMRNRLVGAPGNVQAEGTGEIEEIPVGLVFRSVGYRGIPIPGVAFDHRSGKIPNTGGRVEGHPREYVVGWAKRGPSGLIGTNRGDSILTVKALLDDVPAMPDRALTEVIPGILGRRGVHVTSYEDWKKIDAAEIARGQATGKLREKFVRIGDMLTAL